VNNFLYRAFYRWHWVLPIISGLLLMGCANYCFFIWVPPPTRSFIVPDIGIICGIYCGTLSKLAGVFTIISSLGLILAGIAEAKGYFKAGALLAIFFGLICVPVGLLAIFSGFFTVAEQW